MERVIQTIVVFALCIAIYVTGVLSGIVYADAPDCDYKTELWDGDRCLDRTDHAAHMGEG